MSKRRTQRLLAVAVGLTLVAAACGGDDDDDATETSEAPAATEAPTEETEAPAATEAPTETAAEGSTPEGTEAPSTEGTTEGTSEGSAPAGEGGTMTVTYDINPDAVWDDGTPITFADFECAYQANLNTPGAIYTAGYDKITSITEGESDKQVVVEFSEVYAPYKDLFRSMIKADIDRRTARTSRPTSTQELPFSALPYKLESWSLDQAVLVPNENYYGENTPVTERIVMVPKADQDTEVASLLSGESDFIFPQAFAGLSDALARTRTSRHAGVRHQLRGAALPAERGPAGRRRLPDRVRQVDRPQPHPGQHLRPDLPRRPAAQLRHVGADDRPVVRPDRVRHRGRHRRRYYDPEGADRDPRGRRLGEGRLGHVGQGRRRADHPLDGQLGQHPP